MSSADLVQTNGLGLGIVVGEIGIDRGLQVGDRAEDAGGCVAASFSRRSSRPR